MRAGALRYLRDRPSTDVVLLSLNGARCTCWRHQGWTYAMRSDSYRAGPQVPRRSHSRTEQLPLPDNPIQVSESVSGSMSASALIEC